MGQHRAGERRRDPSRARDEAERPQPDADDRQSQPLPFLLEAGLVDRFRVVVFPVITGSTGSERIYDGYPDVGLDMLDSRTFDGRIQLLEYAPRVLDGPPA